MGTLSTDKYPYGIAWSYDSLSSTSESDSRATELTPTHARDMVFATSLALSSKAEYL